MSNIDKNPSRRVLLAGATGYLGSHIARVLAHRGFCTRVIVRNIEKLKRQNIQIDEMIEAELTDPDEIRNCCRNIDVVISAVGFTRQKDGLTYMDVDYQANLNLLNEARASGVKKFVYVSVLNGERLRHLKICKAKEAFADRLKMSGIEYCIVRPNGFFSDMAEVYAMAEKGRVYLFGDGNLKINPIHGRDLAAVCVDAVAGQAREIEVGGPETFTHSEIAATAFEVLNKKPKVTHVPDWVRAAMLKLSKFLMSSKAYGPIEFFLTVMAIDMVAPEYGECTLKDYFTHLGGLRN